MAVKPRSVLSLSRIFAVVVALFVVGGLFMLAFQQASFHLAELHFNAYAIPSGVTVLLMIGLGFYFMRQPARTDERVWLMVYLVGAAVYSFAELMQRLSVTPQAASFWLVFEACGIIFSPALYLFALYYTEASSRRYTATTAILLVSTGILVFFYGFTSVLFNNDPASAQLFPWGYITPANSGETIAFVWYAGLLVLALARLISFRRRTRNPILRRQSLIFILAISFPLVTGLITDSLLPILGITVLPPLGATLEIPAAIALIYGIVRYQLATINPTQFSSTILNIMQEAVVATDKHLNIMYLNPKAEALLHIKAEGRDHASLTSVIAKHSVDTFQTAFAAASEAKGELALNHIDIAPHESAEVPVRLTGSRLKLDRLEVWVLALADITMELQTRKIIEHEVQVRTNQLHRAQSYLESSINSLEQGFILVNRTAQVELMNGRAAKLLSLSGKAAGASLADLTKSVAWNVDLPQLVHKVLSGHHAAHVEVATASGLFFQVFITPIVDGVHILGATVIIQDVTEQKILNRSKDEFFSIASHELRTPLTAIRGNMDLLHEYFPQAMKDKSLARMVDDTHAASVRLIEIVNDFLDSSKLEQGKMEFTIAPVALAPLVERVTHDLRSILEARGATVVVEGLSKAPKVLADENRLHQILSNLMSNSAKYGEKVTITISVDTKGEHVRLHVADNGKGISPEGQKLLFHKFQQAGDSLLRRDDTKGTGLGLYISRLLATNMKGNVELESTEVGKGSTFVVTLPNAATHK